MCFWFAANISGDFEQYRVDLVSQTPIVKAMLVAQQCCAETMQQTLTWLASNLMQSDVITNEERVQLCLQVGKASLKSLSDRVLSDAGYLFERAFEKIGKLDEQLSLQLME